ncbi:MAG: hypothetical protein HQL30_12430 [Candidatus Omnitrophica bacterium]|nr:hypothetical protein [Candidatus Omnitrophota bacterium]
MKNLALVGVLLCVFSLCHLAYSTEQVPDIITIEDEGIFMWGFSLSPVMERKQNEFIDRPENSKYRAGATTANYDGVQMSLILKGNKLYVSEIILSSFGEAEKKPAYMEVFGVDIPEDGLFADWFSGSIYLGDFYFPKGKLLFDKGILKQASGELGGIIIKKLKMLLR